jgi:hypothetical protein
MSFAEWLRRLFRDRPEVNDKKARADLAGIDERLKTIEEAQDRTAARLELLDRQADIRGYRRQDGS